MKKLTNFALPIDCGISPEQTAAAHFKFQQGTTEKVFDYPGAKITTAGGHFLLLWSVADTEAFEAGRDIKVDAWITPAESSQQLQCEPTTVRMTPTLFTRAEVETYD